MRRVVEMCLKIRETLCSVAMLALSRVAAAVQHSLAAKAEPTVSMLRNGAVIAKRRYSDFATHQPNKIQADGQMFLQVRHSTALGALSYPIAFPKPSIASERK